MNILILGGGNVGEKLAKQLIKSKHQVTLIEKEMETARVLSAELDTIVLNADGTDRSDLADAKVQEADVFIAVTGDDKTNLFACQLASKMGAKKILARVNDPEDLELFLDMDITAINTTLVTVSAIEDSIKHLGGVPKIASIANEEGQIVRLLIQENSPAVGRNVGDLSLMRNVFAVGRGNKLMLHDESHLLREGDVLYALVRDEAEMKQAKELIGAKN
ncbi:MAG: NAD-binding protein [Thaumarchaeota archaeon]|nr:NAD-binding protein [Nitrososphaerota archaeon]MCL5317788.1 NAD-binding protein [Nitrososphaerota archaeon]